MTDTLKRIKNTRENGGNLKGEKEHGKITQPKKELKIKGCLLHNSDLWKTPKELYNYYTKKLNCFDVCPENPKFDGLKIDWEYLNYCNPPYSQIKKWVQKAITEMKKGKTTHMLLPARTDTEWFYNLTNQNVNIIFLKGRLHFDDGKNPAPFPSMIVILGPFIYQKGHTSYCVYTKENIKNMINW